MTRTGPAPAPVPKPKMVHMEIPEWLYELARERSAPLGIQPTVWIRMALQEYLAGATRLSHLEARMAGVEARLSAVEGVHGG